MKNWLRKLFSVHYTATVGEIVLENLPFEPVSNEVIYATHSSDEAVDRLFRRHYKKLQKKFGAHFQKFVYLPLLSEEMVADTKFWQYNQPQECWAERFSRPVLGNDYLLRFVRDDDAQKVALDHFLLQYDQRSDYELPQGQYRFICVSIDPSECENATRYADYMATLLHNSTQPYRNPAAPVVRYRMAPAPDADGNFSRDIMEELQDIQKRVQNLRKSGISRAFLKEFLLSEPPLSRLLIDANYRIWLPDYQNLEIKMTPLVKSVYLLFLRHPEGILFKELEAYQQELAQIYVCVREKKPLWQTPFLHLRINEHIKALTDPLDNSINEKCARIKEAFILLIDDDIARHYYVDGHRGEPKRIALPPDKIVWEV